MRKRALTVFLLAILAYGCREEEVLKQSHLEYSLGNTRVKVVLHEANGSSLLFFNMHDDENTAVEAGLRMISLLGGRLLELQHSGERLVEYQDRGMTYRFDPNRIFTQPGIEKTLERYSRADPQSVAVVQHFAQNLISDAGLAEVRLIVTLHNNGEGDYSAESYLPGADFGTDAESVHLQPDRDPDDFFFVTEERLFQLIKRAGFNVVLQDNTTVTDDGSLSVWAGRKGIPYINVEAQAGHLEQQSEMIQEVYRVADGYFN